MGTFQAGLNIALLFSLFSGLGYLLQRTNTMKYKAKREVDILRRNGQLKMIFIFLFLCIALVIQLVSLLSFSGVLYESNITILLFILVAFLYSFAKYLKESKC